VAVSTSLDSQIRIWDLEQLKQQKIIDIGAAEAWTARFSPDSKHIVTGSSSGNLNQFSVESGEKVQTFEGRGKFSMCVAYVSLEFFSTKRIGYWINMDRVC